MLLFRNEYLTKQCFILIFKKTRIYNEYNKYEYKSLNIEKIEKNPDMCTKYNYCHKINAYNQPDIEFAINYLLKLVMDCLLEIHIKEILHSYFLLESIEILTYLPIQYL